MSKGHAWKFARVGGFDQVQLTTGADIVALPELDQKLWVALACPTKGLEFDARTLELMDTDKDGRIRAAELLAAITWTAALLEDVESLPKSSAALELTQIKPTEEGKRILEAAKKILKGLGKADAKSISVADTADAQAAFAKQALNGDGVVTAEDVEDADLKKVVADVLATLPGETDKNGKKGVSAATVKTFFDEVAAHAAWLEKGESDAAIHVLGAGTAEAFAAYVAVRAKLDDYFARCRVGAYDGRALAALNRDEKAYAELAVKELDLAASEVASFPLAQVQPARALPLGAGLNPAWAERMAAFVAKVVQPMLGARDALTEAEWRELKGKLAAREAWAAGKQGALVEKLGAPRVLALAKGEARKQLDELVAADKAQEPVANAIASVEKLVRYHRDLFKLCNNYVSFRDFYARKIPAIFQAGTLYLDQRSCDLVLHVHDAAKHATMAPLARAYLVYCDCARATGEKLSIVAAVTDGDVDNLMVGRNGIFYDRSGKDWDATVTKIIDNPISIRQAFWAPYKKVVRFAEEQIARRAAAADEASQGKLMGAAQEVDHAADAPAGAPAPAAKKLDVGVVAALGVAVGGITAAFGALLGAFFGLGLWMPLGVLGVILLISGPSMAVAWLKLRQRNVGPVLDANGWAVNAFAKLNTPFGVSLTKVATLPKGSSRELLDPFAEKKRPWRLWLVVAVLVALAGGYYLGRLDPYLPGPAKSTKVFGSWAPSATPAARPAAAPAR